MVVSRKLDVRAMPSKALNGLEVEHEEDVTFFRIASRIREAMV